MKITINGRQRNATGFEAVYWSLFAFAITAMTLLWVGFIFLLLASPLWLPFAIIIWLVTK